MDPTAITHVILPCYMQAFAPVYAWPVDVRFAGMTKAPQMTYYDNATMIQRSVDLANVPNLQGELEALENEGTRQMITHTTHV